MRLPEGQAFAKNIEAIGYHDMAGRPAFKLAMHRRGERWYLYTAHFWHSGWSILDVTDATDPQLVRFIEGPANTHTGQIQIADGLMITSMEKAPKVDAEWRAAAEKYGFEEGIGIWSLADDPENPKPLGQLSTGGDGAHRNYYDGGRYLHATIMPPGYEGRIYSIVDIADPANPVEVSRWWVEGQWTAGGESGAPPGTSLHGGAYVKGDRTYLPYSGAGLQILDISDVKAPRRVANLPFSPPFVSYVAVHTAQPLTQRPLVVVNSEPVNEGCQEPLSHVSLVDISDETDPRLISLFPMPEAPAELPYRSFCQKGGRFGPHNQHQWQFQDVLLHDEERVYLTYFNAGLRVFDISDERLPREIGFYVPPDPTKRIGRLPRTLTCSSEDVLVDARGNIYVSDKNHGIHVLRTVQ
jgi:hypothetical protein